MLFILTLPTRLSKPWIMFRLMLRSILSIKISKSLWMYRCMFNLAPSLDKMVNDFEVSEKFRIRGARGGERGEISGKNRSVASFRSPLSLSYSIFRPLSRLFSSFFLGRSHGFVQFLRVTVGPRSRKPRKREISSAD